MNTNIDTCTLAERHSLQLNAVGGAFERYLVDQFVASMVPRELERLRHEGIDCSDAYAIVMACGPEVRGGGVMGHSRPITARQDVATTGRRYSVPVPVGWTAGPVFFTDTYDFLRTLRLEMADLANSSDPDFRRLSQGFGIGADGAERLMRVCVAKASKLGLFDSRTHVDGDDDSHLSLWVNARYRAFD